MTQVTLKTVYKQEVRRVLIDEVGTTFDDLSNLIHRQFPKTKDKKLMLHYLDNENIQHDITDSATLADALHEVTRKASPLRIFVDTAVRKAKPWVTLEIAHQSNTKQHELTGPVTYSDLIALVITLFPAISSEPDAFSVQYKDDEGDLVSITMDTELAEAFRFAQTSGSDRLRFRVNSRPPRSTSIPSPAAFSMDPAVSPCAKPTRRAAATVDATACGNHNRRSASDGDRPQRERGCSSQNHIRECTQRVFAALPHLTFLISGSAAPRVRQHLNSSVRGLLVAVGIALAMLGGGWLLLGLLSSLLWLLPTMTLVYCGWRVFSRRECGLPMVAAISLFMLLCPSGCCALPLLLLLLLRCVTVRQIRRGLSSRCFTNGYGCNWASSWGSHTSVVHPGELLPAAPVRRGAQGEGVAQLQRVLIRLGHMHPAHISCLAGRYGPRTADAVAAFQRDVLQSAPTGVFDANVRTRLLAELDSFERPAARDHHRHDIPSSAHRPIPSAAVPTAPVAADKSAGHAWECAAMRVLSEMGFEPSRIHHLIPRYNGNVQRIVHELMQM